MTNASINSMPIDQSMDAIREKAAHWLLSLEGATADERKAYDIEVEAWFEIDKRHRQVFEQMQGIWSASDNKVSKRHVKHPLSGLSMLALVAAMFTQVPWDYWTATHRSNVGEIQTIQLADGTEATLNTNSAVNIKFDNNRRHIELVRGEVMVTVAKDSTRRTFSIVTPHGSANAMGTIYSARLKEQETIVSVYESSVEVTPRQNPNNAVILNAGQSAWLSKNNVSDALPVKQRKPDWAQGKLVFNNVPLAGVVKRLNNYRQGTISISADVVERDLHFTGLVPAQDSDAALALIADALGLKLNQFTAYRVWFESRSDTRS